MDLGVSGLRAATFSKDVRTHLIAAACRMQYGVVGERYVFVVPQRRSECALGCWSAEERTAGRGGMGASKIRSIDVPGATESSSRNTGVPNSTLV